MSRWHLVFKLALFITMPWHFLSIRKLSSSADGTCHSVASRSIPIYSALNHTTPIQTDVERVTVETKLVDQWFICGNRCKFTQPSQIPLPLARLGTAIEIHTNNFANLGLVFNTLVGAILCSTNITIRAISSCRSSIMNTFPIDALHLCKIEHLATSCHINGTSYFFGKLAWSFGGRDSNFIGICTEIWNLFHSIVYQANSVSLEVMEHIVSVHDVLMYVPLHPGQSTHDQEEQMQRW